MKQEIEMTELDFRSFRDFIHERFGLFFGEEKASFFRMKLYPRMAALGCTSFYDYLQTVKFGSGGEAEKMISLLTNTETYFFREEPQLNCFRDEILPALWQEKMNRGDRKLRIVSAGCSTGEEAYTLAMLVFEAGTFFWDWDVKIIGVDINERAVETARKGVYPERSFRMGGKDYARRFFTQDEGHYSAKPNIRGMAEFVRGNICLPETFEALESPDAIFCRNVLIYFSDKKIEDAAGLFYDSLTEGGYLFLGHSETLTNVVNRFEVVRCPQSIIYRKPKANKIAGAKEEKWAVGK